jgi:hypothetical protein
VPKKKKKATGEKGSVAKRIKMDADTWIDTYLPTFTPEGDLRMYETYGEDLEHVVSVHEKKPLHVWTLVEGDSGKLWVAEGFHRVNRMNYLITQKPAVKGAEYMVAWD